MTAPTPFDSAGWPLDAAGWPLPPDGRQFIAGPPYRAAIARAKALRTRRERAAAAFDFATLRLTDIHPRLEVARSTPEALPW